MSTYILQVINLQITGKTVLLSLTSKYLSTNTPDHISCIRSLFASLELF